MYLSLEHIWEDCAIIIGTVKLNGRGEGLTFDRRSISHCTSDHAQPGFSGPELHLPSLLRRVGEEPRGESQLRPQAPSAARPEQTYGAQIN